MNSSNPIEDKNNGADGVSCISLLGVKVHRVDMETTMRMVHEYVQSDTPHIIVTADASAIVRAREDSEFKNIVNNADLVTPDGAGIIKGAAMLGTPLITRVSGVDIAQNIFKMAAKEGFSVFLLGATPGTAEMAAQKMKEKYPDLQVAGTHHGYFTPNEDAAIAAKVRNSGAKALLVALGIPRQEKFIANHLDQLGVGVAIGVGGTFDVLSGQINRAPKFYQDHGLEWIYRLAKDPKKISKVAALPKFVRLVLTAKLFGRNRQQA